VKKQLLVLSSILLLFLVPPSVSRAETKENNEGVTIDLLDRYGDVAFTIYSGFEKMVISESGNFLWTITFKIDKENPIMNFPGPVRILEISLKYDIDGDDEEETITDTMAVLTKSGNLKLIFHANGAGNRLPPGWDF